MKASSTEVSGIKVEGESFFVEGIIEVGSAATTQSVWSCIISK
jgi:hypothetical protein